MASLVLYPLRSPSDKTDGASAFDKVLGTASWEFIALRLLTFTRSVRGREHEKFRSRSNNNLEIRL